MIVIGNGNIYNESKKDGDFMKRKVSLAIVIILIVVLVFTLSIKKTHKSERKPTPQGLNFTIASGGVKQDEEKITHLQGELIGNSDASSVKEWQKWDASHPHYQKRKVTKGAFTYYIYVLTHDAKNHQPWLYVYIMSKVQKNEVSSGVETYCESYPLKSAQSNTVATKKVEPVMKMTANSVKLKKGTYEIKLMSALLTAEEYDHYQDARKFGNLHNRQKIKIVINKA